MKLTKQARKELREVLSHLGRAQDQIRRLNKTVPQHKKQKTAITLHLERCGNCPHCSYDDIDKKNECSDLEGLQAGIHLLATFLVRNQ